MTPSCQRQKQTLIPTLALLALLNFPLSTRSCVGKSIQMAEGNWNLAVRLGRCASIQIVSKEWVCEWVRKRMTMASGARISSSPAWWPTHAQAPSSSTSGACAAVVCQSELVLRAVSAEEAHFWACVVADRVRVLQKGEHARAGEEMERERHLRPTHSIVILLSWI